MILQILAEVAIYLGVPALLSLGARHVALVRRIGPVLFAYGAGLLLGNQPFWQPSQAAALATAQVAVAVAIPLLLFPLDVMAWLRLARATVISFAVCVCSVLVVTAIAAVGFRDLLGDAPEIAGMLVGVYTGGTPNMAAIGTALGVDPSRFVLLNAADILVSSVYLVFLLTVAGRLLGRLLPPTPAAAPTEAAVDAETPAPWRTRGPTLLAALAVVGFAWGIGQLATGEAHEAVTILAITTSALFLSHFPRVRSLPGSAATGEGALLVFCVAIGATSDFERLVSSSPVFVALVAVVVIGSVLLHLGVAMIFKLDRDTVIITSTAAIYGPAFVPPVAAALGNREIVLSGLMTGLAGYAVGNYLGIGLAWLLG